MVRFFSRRVFLQASVVPMAATLLAACGEGDSDASAPATSASNSARPTTAPAVGGTATTQQQSSSPVGGRPGGKLVVGLDVAFQTLDPNVSQSRTEAYIFMNIFDSLVLRTPDLEFHPSLAKSWEISSDGRTFTFKLQEGVKFHDGSPLNAAAVKHNFDRIVDPATKSLLAISLIGPYERGEVIDDHAVALHFKEPFAPLLDGLSWGWLGIVSPSGVQQHGANFFRNPVGSGPFKFKEWVNDDHVVLVRNEEYNWASPVFQHQGPAYIEELQFRYIKEHTARVGAMETGETQLTVSTPPQEVDRLESSGKFAAMIGLVPGQPVVYHLNTTKPPTDDVAVRRAINHAIDKQAIVDTLYFGQFPAAYGPLSPTTFGYWKGVEDMYSYDPKKAEELLDAAGWTASGGGTRQKNGAPLSIDFVTPLEPQLGVAVQSQLRDIGIDWKIREVTFQAEEAIVENAEQNAVHLRFPYGDADMLRITFHSSNIPSPGRFVFGWSYYRDDRLDDLIEQGASTLDSSERVKIYEQAQQLIMDQALILPLYVTTMIVTHPMTVKGLRFEGHNYHVWLYDVWLDA